MSPPSTLRTAGLLLAGAVALHLAAGEAKPKPTKQGEPPVTAEDIRNQIQSPIASRRVGEGTLHDRFLEDKGGGQRIALWVPDGVPQLRGLIVSMHRASEAHRSDLQAWARGMGFGVVGMLIRWKGYEWLIDEQIRQFGVASGHPEIADVPLVVLGFSRNCGAWTEWMRRRERSADRVLAVLFGGGPGASLRLTDAADLALFRGVPVLQVNGSSDPFVEQMEWQRKVYPPIRAAGLPFGVAVDWGVGHNWHRAIEIHIPFVQAAWEARVPKGWSPTQGPVRLLPIDAAQGWLADPGAWDGKRVGAPVPAAQYAGDPAKAVWLPDEDTAATWRAFVSTDTAAQPIARTLAGGRVALALRDAPAGATVRWRRGARELGVGAGADGRLETAALAQGAHSVHAVLDVDGATQLTRTLAIVDGAAVDGPAGVRSGGKADLPVNAADLPEGPRATLQALDARRSSPAMDGWMPVYRNDFAQPLGPEWYEFYHADPERPIRGKEDSRAEAKDGVLEVQGTTQAVAMLRWVWPDDIAVEYRCQAAAEKHCDLSVVLAGRPTGRRFPWEQGLMFQFGADFNAQSRWLVVEQKKAATTAALIRPGAWHAIRVERLGGVCRASVDGKLVAEHTMSEEEIDQQFSNRIGFYTFASLGRFDDVVISMRVASDPSRVQPAAPDEAAMDALLAALVERTQHRFFEPRFAAERVLRAYAMELLPAMRRALAAGAIADGAMQERFAALVREAPPVPR